MSQSENAQQEKDDNDDDTSCLLFSCQCESARSVSTLLSSLKHVTSSSSSSSNLQNNPVTVFCSPTSLTFHVYGKARQSQASVDMQAGLFSQYYVRPRNDNNDNDQQDDEDNWQAGGEFCVNLHTVLECLHVCSSTFSSNNNAPDHTRLCFSYDLSTEIFRMELLDERGVLTTAAIPGMVPPLSKTSSLALAFRSSAICARMICHSHVVKEAMHELELVPGATTCTVALSQEEGLELATVGDVGECLISLPAAGMLSLESQTNSKARNYPLHSLRSGMRALDIAQETCVSINLQGMMAIQHQVLDTVGSGSPNFVDFIMGCLQDDENEEQEEEDEQRQSMTVGTSQEQSVDALQSQRSGPPSMTWDDDNRERVGSVIDEDDNNDSDEEDLLPPVSSVQPLFASVVVGRGGTQQQQQRRKRQARHRPSSVDDHHSSDDDDDGSRALLDEPSENEESQPLDVTARVRRSKRRDHHDGSSSPEVVYGEMSQDPDF